MSPDAGQRFRWILLGIYIAVFAVCAISPHDRAVWVAENLPIVVIVAAVVLVSRKHAFSPTSCVLMLVLPVMHTIGGHYTFERVPFDVVNDLVGGSRNHYDRIAHFSVGFFAYALAEFLLVRRLVRSAWILILFPLLAIISVAGVYEILEWLYAVSSDPTAGAAVLGSQGDEWDAQKDILADTLGAVFALVLFWVMRRRDFLSLRTTSPCPAPPASSPGCR
jgi:putative membrane protein